MKVGEQRILKIRPNLAYGKQGYGTISQGWTLVFYVGPASPVAADTSA